MEKELIFITGNQGKLLEAQAILPGIVGKDLDLPEIQELNAEKVIEAKLLEAYKIHKGEYVVEDTSVYIDTLGGLPGPLIKWFLQSLGDEGLAGLVEGKENTSAQAITLIGHMNETGSMSFFEGRIAGTIVPPRGENGFGWDKIFLPDKRNKTFGEMSVEEKNSMSMRKSAFKKLADFLSKQ